MRKYLFVIATILITSNAISQNENLDFKYALKLYNLTTYDSQKSTAGLGDSSSSYLENISSTWKILHPTIAFQWVTKKNNFQEIELTSFMFQNDKNQTNLVTDTSLQVTAGSRNRSMAISLRYEYNWNFNKKNNRKFVPSLGLGLRPYFTKNNYTPSIPSSFPSKQTNLGVKICAIPRISYYINSRIFVDVNLPLSIGDLGLKQREVDNPSIPVGQRKISQFNYNSTALFSARIGVGIKI